MAIIAGRAARRVVSVKPVTRIVYENVDIKTSTDLVIRFTPNVCSTKLLTVSLVKSDE